MKGKFVPGNPAVSYFHLLFGQKIPYDIPAINQWSGIIIQNGAPRISGLLQANICSNPRDASGEYLDASGGMIFAYETEPWISSAGNLPVLVVDISGGTDASGGNCCQLDIDGERAIYMEIEKYNSMDELTPWSKNTMGMFNNDYSGKVNSAFAKIPVGLFKGFHSIRG